MNLNNPVKVIIIGVFIILCPHLTRATVFNVNSTLDTPDAVQGDGICDDGSGNCTLRAAVQECNALAGADQINLPVGIYILTGASGENAAASGDLDLRSDIDIIGADTRTTIINANFIDRPIHCNNPTVTINISNLELINGSVNDNGGGIYNTATLTLTDVAIKNCTSNGSSSNLAGGHGGGIYNTGTLNINYCTLSANWAIGGNGVNGVNGGGGGGGAAAMGAGLFNTSTGVVNILNSTFSGNTARGGRGGHGSTNNGFVSTSGSNGGGQLGGAGGPSGSTATAGGFGSGGGGSGSSGGGPPPGADGGFGGGAGGGGASSLGGTSGGSGTPGLGGSPGGTTCCSAGGSGGGGAGMGAAIFNNEGTIDIQCSTIAFNTSAGGLRGNNPWTGSNQGVVADGVAGGILNYNTGIITLQSTIVSYNNASFDNDLYGNFTSNDYNLLSIIGSAIVTGTTTNDLYNVSAVLIPLANNGGNTDTHYLGCNSPAFNAGNCSAADDQIGIARPLETQDEIGAAEVETGTGPLPPPGFINN